MDLNAPNSLHSISESQQSSIIQLENCEKLNSIDEKMFRNIATINTDKLQQSKSEEHLKRKKSKLRNTIIPPINNPYYPKELDTWLENCIKDVNAPHLSSSSEFLDYNTSSFTSNKNPITQINTDSNKPIPLSQNTKLNNTGYQKSDIMNYSLNFDKMFRNLDHNDNNNSLGGGGGGGGEFASLPPLINFGPNFDSSRIENFDRSDPSRSFRFSDPCLIGISDNESTKISEQNNSENKNTNTNDTNKFLATLLEQINILRETNSKICKNLHETKAEIEALKHTSLWGGGGGGGGLRHRRDSLSGLSTHSQPMGFGFGNQSPAPTYHSGIYTPGMMTDVVREVKEAARVREEALLNRVKAMVEERSWSIGEGNFRLIHDIDEMKAQIQHLKSDRKETNKRITQLEAENKYLKSILISILNNKNMEIMNENENMIRSNQFRKNHQQMESTITNPINFRQNKISSDAANISHHHESLNQQIIGGGGGGVGVGSGGGGETFQQALLMHERNKIQHKPKLYDINVSKLINQSPSQSQLNSNILPTNNGAGGGGNHSSSLIENKDTMELRRELQEALVSKKQAENRVIALENMVKNLQVKVTHSAEDCNSDGGGGDGSGSRGVCGRVGGGGGNGIGGIYNNDSTTNTSTNNSGIIMNNNNNNDNISQITNLSQHLNQYHHQSQIQVLSSKLSLAGPITDL